MKFIHKILKKYIQTSLSVLLTGAVLWVTSSFYYDKKQIDVYNLIIISVLAFALMYKLVQYLSRFKIEKQYSRIDIVMMIVFFTLLFIPMSYISNAEKSKRENRMLAPKPQLMVTRGKINNFGEQFDAWFSDRFLGREVLISLHSSLNFIISKFAKNDLAIKTPDDMIFNIKNISKLSHTISHSVLEKISKNLKKLQDFTKQNNIELYVMIPPAKEDIYKEKLQNIFADIKPNESIVYDLQKYISKKNKLNIIYPRDIYFKDYKDFTYYKTDHHWTEFGAFLSYQKLIENIRKKHPDIVPLTENDFNTFYKKQPRLGNFKNLFDRPFL